MTFPNVSFFLCDHLVFTILQHNFYLFVYQGHRASRSTPSTIFSKILWKIWCHMSNSPDPSDTEVTLSEKSDSSQYLNCLWAAWQLVVEHHLVSAVGCCSLVNVFLHLLYLHCNPRHVFLIISLKEPSHYLSLPMLIYPIHKCKNKFSFFFFFFMAVSSPDVSSVYETIYLPYRAVKLHQAPWFVLGKTRYYFLQLYKLTLKLPSVFFSQFYT